MISRRNIRVKVLQLLYALETQQEAPKQDPALTLKKKLDDTRSLFLYLLHTVVEVARYAETDAAQRAGRHLPSADDMNVNTKLAGNTVLWNILENDVYRISIENETTLQHEYTRHNIRRIYQQMVASTTYQQYISTPERSVEGEKQILQFILTDLMLPNDDYINHVEEIFTNWDDDAEMINTLLLSYLNKQSNFNLADLLGAEKLQFAQNLLRTVREKKDHLMGIIKPKLKNWDPERIARLDLIMLKMGLSELLYFETIPPKVTLNEYIDIAKEYSTPQSGQFLNGILDGIHKDLLKDEQLVKVDFKRKA